MNVANQSCFTLFEFVAARRKWNSMSSTFPQLPIDLPLEAIGTFCHRWHIQELALFGSILREDFDQESDIDVLVTFTPEAPPIPDRQQMRQELETLLGRPVDVVYRRVIEHDPNYLLRNAILKSARVIYAA